MLNVIELSAARTIIPLIVAQILVLNFSLSIGAQPLSPGSLDPTFGNGGIVTTETGTIANSQSLVIQSDGKIVISGNALFGGSVGFGLARYHTDGSLDNSFSNDGVLTSIPLDTNNDWVSSMALQLDQKIIVAGGTQLDRNDVESGWAFRLSRYNSDGTLDPSFGSSGNVITILEPSNIACWIDNISSIAIQADGKIVAVGTSCLIGGFTVVRYNPNGTIDGTFGINGIVTTQTTDHLGPGADAVGIQADGKIVVTGVQRSGENLVVVARYHPNGSLDVSFNSDGKAEFAFRPLSKEEVATLSIQPDNRILIGGFSGAQSARQFALARLNPDGSKDVTFGENGIVLTQFGADARLFALAIQSDGKIIACGSSLVIGTARYSAGLIRYDTAGKVDTSYGSFGKVLIDFGGRSDGSGVVVDSVGRAVVSGSVENSFAVARLLGDTAVASERTPFDYDGDGKSDASVYRPTTNEWHIAQSGGGIRVQGWGLAGDKMAPADFDGDGKTDIAVYRPSEGNWYVLNSANNTVTVAGWGLATDKLVPGDYNGDGKADFVVFRESEGRWYRRDTDGQVHFQDWGLPGDKPAPADFDGDGRLDLTVFRPSEGRWYTIRSSDAAMTATDWGVSGDIPVAADYSGDGKADFVVFRPSDLTWYRRHSDDNSLHFITWGIAGDIPAPGDFDGDGKTDLAVYRPSNGTWYIFGSQAGIYSQPFGLTGDVPTPNSYVY